MKWITGYVGVVNRSQDDLDNDVNNSQQAEDRVLSWPEFAGVQKQIGIDILRRYMTNILAKKVKRLLPEMRQRREEELKYIKYGSYDVSSLRESLL